MMLGRLELYRGVAWEIKSCATNGCFGLIVQQESEGVVLSIDILIATNDGIDLVFITTESW